MHVLRADDGRVAINDLGVAYFTLAASIGAPKVTMVFLNDDFEEKKRRQRRSPGKDVEQRKFWERHFIIFWR